MIFVALIVIASAAAGVVADRRSEQALVLSRWCLNAMLYGLVPFVAFVNFAHLTLTLGSGVGLVAAYVGLGVAGFLAYLAGRSLGLARPSRGALIIAVLLVNTGYLGYPVSVALLGHHALTHAVAYDQVVSTPLVFTAGFAIGAAFAGPDGTRRPRSPLRSLLFNPPLWAALAGLIGGPVLAPRQLVSIGDTVVDVFLVLGFFTVGVALSSERRAEGGSIFQRPDRAVLVALALRFSVTPAVLTLLAAAGVGIPNAYLLQAGMPSAINGLMIANAYGLDKGLVATAIVWSTLAVLIVATVAYVV